MEQCKLGDRVSMESERVGQSAREGVIVEVLGSGDATHYRVRWDNGHESTLFPGAGSVRIVAETQKAESR